MLDREWMCYLFFSYKSGCELHCCSVCFICMQVMRSGHRPAPSDMSVVTSSVTETGFLWMHCSQVQSRMSVWRWEALRKWGFIKASGECVHPQACSLGVRTQAPSFEFWGSLRGQRSKTRDMQGAKYSQTSMLFHFPNPYWQRILMVTSIAVFTFADLWVSKLIT